MCTSALIWFLAAHYYINYHAGISLLLLCSIDLPAKAILCNMSQFNGENWCSTCEDSGDNTVTATHMHRVWPYSLSNTLTTTVNVHSAIKSAVEKKQVVGCEVLLEPLPLTNLHTCLYFMCLYTFLFKYRPILGKHKSFNLVVGVATDYMHCVLLGITKYFLSLWLDGIQQTKAFYIIG